MSDDPVRTQVRTDDGWLEFQEYFVHRHQEPEVHEVRFDGIDRAEATARVRGELGFAEMIVIAPSNPIVSIGPILAVRGVRDLLAAARRGGTPIAGGQPDRRRQGAQGAGRPDAGEPRPRGVRPRRRPTCTQGIVDGFVLDTVDAALAPAVEALGMRTLVTDTVMTDDASRERLAARDPRVRPRGPGLTDARRRRTDRHGRRSAAPGSWS